MEQLPEMVVQSFSEAQVKCCWGEQDSFQTDWKARCETSLAMLLEGNRGEEVMRVSQQSRRTRFPRDLALHAQE